VSAANVFWSLAPVLFYVVGYILIATSNGVSQFAAGTVFQAAYVPISRVSCTHAHQMLIIYSGSTGLQLLTQVIIADITSLRYRGLLSSLMSLPYIINAFVGSKIAASITTADPVNGWRWGYGMFSILVPCTIFPVVSTLAWGERRALKLGLVKVDKAAAIGKSDGAGGVKAFFKSAVAFVIDMDLMGLVLLGTGWALLLIALTLAGADGWSNREYIDSPLFVGSAIDPWSLKRPSLPWSSWVQ